MTGVGERNLTLGLIGNCAFNALIDAQGHIVWCCLPRPDDDPVFSALLAGGDVAARGLFAIELEGLAESRQAYVANTAILQTELVDTQGNAVRITDFAPRFQNRGRTFRPLLLVRRVWYIDALVRTGATEEARGLFAGLIESRNPLGLLSEDIDPASREPWGNFPQTYSMVGIINGATRLSRRWDTVL
jgi:GH15 family glucan-1,4-alpha-glucosidase